jgi:RNA polymerase sigma-70 factor, ECF subfamily
MTIAGAVAGTALAVHPTERLETLWETHSDRLYRLARRLTASADAARDLVQDTFVRAASKAGSIPRGVRDEEAWLVRVMVNLQRDQWRKTAVRRRAHEQPLEPVSSDAEAALIARTTVWQALDLLPPRRRAVLIMYELEGLAIPVIASLLSIS